MAQRPAPMTPEQFDEFGRALDAIRDCLPEGHPRRAELSAKAWNRLGDAQFLSGATTEAVASYDAAIALAPGDAYPIYNRGRANLVLGNADEAKADFTTAVDPKFKQPKARKLAQQALSEFE